MRRFAELKRLAIGQEINRLLAAKFIREIKKSDWVANPVLVPKKNTDILRMCVDFTSLNKCCPKDHFPLPRIDQIVDSTAGCERLCFLDAYSVSHPENSSLISAMISRVWKTFSCSHNHFLSTRWSLNWLWLCSLGNFPMILDLINPHHISTPLFLLSPMGATLQCSKTPLSTPPKATTSNAALDKFYQATK